MQRGVGSTNEGRGSRDKEIVENRDGKGRGVGQMKGRR